ncbi:MAG TPA: BON domain-containing protein [Terriglobales bacterium]|jgi:hyperosmotically inducible protein
MRRLLLFSQLLLISAGAVAQTSPATPASPSPSTSAVLISSNGPVVADYGKQPQSSDPAENNIAKEVRHELLMLPYYSLFDDLEYTVQGRTVTLSGSLSSEHAVTKSDAENAVKRIEGVDKVIDNIKVLPASPMDEQARIQVYRSLANTGSLSRYFWEAAPSIHIIVDNQRVTLKGFVNSEMDKNLATIAANQVPGIFQVTNELRVVK